MFEQYHEQIKKEAEAAYPLEAVWLITEKGCWQAENIAESPEDSFQVCQQDSFKAYKEGLLAIVHSHCDVPVAPSKLDMEGQVLSGVPWGIYQIAKGQFIRKVWWGPDVPMEPLLGRIFIHGIGDCYTLVKDFYSQYGIDLDIVPRDWEWWNSEDLIEDLWEDFGFYEIPSSQMRYGDVLVIRVRGNHSHHCGIMVGNEEFIHHPGSNDLYDPSRLSVKDSVHRYMPYVTRVLRHREFTGEKND